MSDICENKSSCSNRREFLVKAGIITGGLFLTISGLSNVSAQESDTFTLAIDAKSKLNTVGGSEVVKTKVGKIVVVKTNDNEYLAFTAKCPHKGGPVRYNSTNKQLSCSWHDSIFDLEGKNVSGPAKKTLKLYPTESADKSVKINLA